MHRKLTTLAFVVGTNGVLESVVVEKAPTPAIEAKMRAEMGAWLFEPPTKDGHAIKISSKGTITINVIRSPK